MYDVTNPLSPLLELTPASPLMCLQYRYLHYTITIYNIYNIYNISTISTAQPPRDQPAGRRHPGRRPRVGGHQDWRRVSLLWLEISSVIYISPGCPVLSCSVPDSTGDPVTEVAWLVTKSGSEVLASAGCGRVAR